MGKVSDKRKRVIVRYKIKTFDALHAQFKDLQCKGLLSEEGACKPHCIWPECEKLPSEEQVDAWVRYLKQEKQ